MEAKRLQLLRELVPSAAKIAYLAIPKAPGGESNLSEIRAAAVASSIKIQVFNVSSDDEIDAAFTAIKQARTDALFVAAQPLFVTRRDQIVALAARHAIPAS